MKHSGDGVRLTCVSVLRARLGRDSGRRRKAKGQQRSLGYLEVLWQGHALLGVGGLDLREHESEHGVVHQRVEGLREVAI